MSWRSALRGQADRKSPHPPGHATWDLVGKLRKREIHFNTRFLFQSYQFAAARTECYSAAGLCFLVGMGIILPA